MVCIKAPACAEALEDRRETSQHLLAREQLMLCNRAGKSGPEAITVRVPISRDAYFWRSKSNKRNVLICGCSFNIFKDSKIIWVMSGDGVGQKTSVQIKKKPTISGRLFYRLNNKSTFSLFHQ